MKRTERTKLEEALAKNYRDQRDETQPAAVERIVQAMLAEDACSNEAGPQSTGNLAFVAAQIRYIPLWTWIAQAALVVAACLVAHLAGGSGAAPLVIGVLSAMSALVGAPTVQASSLHEMAELEYSCPNNMASVLVARLITLGCSSALAIGITTAAVASPLDVSAFSVALWICPPYFLSCSGCLMMLRKARPNSAMMLCIAWAASCSACHLALALFFPSLYDHASLAVWLAASSLALLWLIRELVSTLKLAAGGLDSFSPHLANTRN